MLIIILTLIFVSVLCFITANRFKEREIVSELMCAIGWFFVSVSESVLVIWNVIYTRQETYICDFKRSKIMVEQYQPISFKNKIETVKKIKSDNDYLKLLKSRNIGLLEDLVPDEVEDLKFIKTPEYLLDLEKELSK